ncbi:adhesion G-protein coupled receptor G1-like [Aquarana catesbeiana]|uniref:adhesion G-protein coupled receptor G1-like n=1 Tax=Aquarana catesbeiana TaxID=8400 RepID=UPI003CC9D553
MTALLTLLLLTGLLSDVRGSSLCGWRNQTENRNILRWNGNSSDNMVRVKNSAEELTVSAPFLPSDNITLPDRRGLYSFCVHWIPGLHILNFTYGITLYHEIHGHPSPRSADSAWLNLTQSCNHSYPLINVTINGERKTNDCLYEYPIQAKRYDAKMLEHDMSQVNRYLEKTRFNGDGRLLRKWIDTALSKVQIDGKSHNFGTGALQAGVYNLDSSDVLKSIPESLGVSLTLPDQLMEKLPDGTAKRLHVVHIQGHAMFQNDTNISILGDQVLGVTLQDTVVSNLSEDIVITFVHEPIKEPKSPLCVFWNESGEEWSTAGCRTVATERQTECHCNHLTYFAVLMQVSSQVISEVHLVSLTAITFAGCAISAMSCAFTVAWICCSRKNKTNPTLQIHMNLLIALLLLDVTFITSALLGGLEDVIVCQVSAIALHFSLLCLFAWMAIEGFNLYRLVVKVFASSAITTWRLSILGWGVPVLMVATVLLVDPKYYGIYYINVERPSSQNSTAAMCWLTEPIIHQVLNLGFFAAVLLFNLCMFVAMTRRALRLSPHSRQEEVRRCVTLLGLSCMLGFSWGLAFFSFGVFYLPVQYAFSILNALQGLFIFLWYCVLSQPHAKYSLRSTDSTSATPASPRADQTLNSDHKKLLT